MSVERLKKDKEYFKEVMLSRIEEWKNRGMNYGICHIYNLVLREKDPDSFYVFDLPKFVVPPKDLPDYGYEGNGSLRLGVNQEMGFWWKGLSIFGSESEDWYAPRIEFIKNL